ncbi:MAG: nitroreductase family protein [Spirochaetes bacterium]|nr:nitroreductase family protein [Spirochaetota bacterium]
MKQIEDIIRTRRSCRTYLPDPLKPGDRDALEQYLAYGLPGPFGNEARMKLITSGEGDADELRGLGTYGFLKNAPAFLAGAVVDSRRALEDYGYLMERMILFATDRGLGTCWLGGTFTRSSFSARVGLRSGETLPAVAAIGYMAERPRVRERLLRRAAGSDGRKPWEELFFDETFGKPLTREVEGRGAFPLAMIRLAPSASNRQPWRIVRSGNRWHFYLARSKGYRERNRSMFGIADMQRIDMGIAMYHFEAAARASALPGSWEEADPGIPLPDTLTEYLVTWREI